MVPGDLNEQREGATLGVAPRCPTQSQLQREVIGLRRIAEHCLGFAHGVRKCAVEHQALHRRCICLLQPAVDRSRTRCEARVGGGGAGGPASRRGREGGGA